MSMYTQEKSVIYDAQRIGWQAFGLCIRGTPTKEQGQPAKIAAGPIPQKKKIAVLTISEPCTDAVTPPFLLLYYSHYYMYTLINIFTFSFNFIII